MIRDEERQRGSAREGKADRSGFLKKKKKERICRMSNLSCSLLFFAEHNACSTQLEQSERKANSFKIGGEITRNWRPFKNIITSLFPQREVRGWGSVLIRTGDELAIKLLSQASPRVMQRVCVCARVKSVCQNTRINNSGGGL